MAGEPPPPHPLSNAPLQEGQNRGLGEGVEVLEWSTSPLGGAVRTTPPLILFGMEGPGGDRPSTM